MLMGLCKEAGPGRTLRSGCRQGKQLGGGHGLAALPPTSGALGNTCIGGAQSTRAMAPTQPSRGNPINCGAFSPWVSAFDCQRVRWVAHLPPPISRLGVCARAGCVWRWYDIIQHRRSGCGWDEGLERPLRRLGNTPRPRPTPVQVAGARRSLLRLLHLTSNEQVGGGGRMRRIRPWAMMHQTASPAWRRRQCGARAAPAWPAPVVHAAGALVCRRQTCPGPQ